MVPEVKELEDLRKQLGLSQSELVAQLDIGRSTWDHYKYRDVRPSYENLKKINNFIEKKKNTKNMR